MLQLERLEDRCLPSSVPCLPHTLLSAPTHQPQVEMVQAQVTVPGVPGVLTYAMPMTQFMAIQTGSRPPWLDNPAVQHFYGSTFYAIFDGNSVISVKWSNINQPSHHGHGGD